MPPVAPAVPAGVRRVILSQSGGSRIIGRSADIRLLLDL